MKIRYLVFLILLASSWYNFAVSLSLAGVGLFPTPILQNIQVQTEASFDLGAQRYTYGYTVSNPASNTGEIQNISIDMTTQIPQAPALPIFDPSGLTIPRGLIPISFEELLARLTPLALPAGTSVLPFGQQAPSGWIGGLGRDGFARFSSLGDNLLPGQTRSGFQIIGPGMPTIRVMRIKPVWAHVVEDHEAVTNEERIAAGDIERSIIFNTFTLGPSALTPGSFGHWDQLRDDLTQATQLGWIPDQALADALVTQLAAARQALNEQDGTLAKSRLQALIQTISQSTPPQRRREVFDLVLLNAQRLVENTPDTVFPFEPKLKLTPQSSTLPLGTLYILTATVINLGDPANPPISGFPLGFQVIDGPHAGLGLSDVTDADGKLSFSYTGTQAGTDKTTAGIFDEVITELGSAEVTWSGGPDLVVPLFVPPDLRIKPDSNRTVFLTEWTANIGTIAVGTSTTRYFISPDPVLDPATARVIGERAVPTLGPGQRSEGGTVTFTLPSDLPAGIYHLAACSDAGGVVVELDEQNNCSFSLLTEQAKVLSAIFLGNNPPTCSQATPSVARLWPPNHKLVTVTVQGVTDPDNDPIAIEVTGITQDEPVNRLGDGYTGPDGFGVGTPQAQLRAERSGTGNGRVYAITFTAADGKGGTCTETVSVAVAHDQGHGAVPIDDGQRFDSTLP